jgi:hypothetical protein
LGVGVGAQGDGVAVLKEGAGAAPDGDGMLAAPGEFEQRGQRSRKRSKWMFEVNSRPEGAASSVKIEGSGWSKRIAPTGA